mmetsp:Transcript_49701/g.126308  ORF Transcript_49701/g.126308 Transcript_49701/m.126308 type:complete len:231 (-) Transcript_49701:997-1689(-)
MVHRVADDLLDVVKALLHRGVLHQGGARVLGVLREGVGMLGVLRPECRELLVVLVCRISEHLLQIVDALTQRGVVCLHGLQALDILRGPPLGRVEFRVGFVQGLERLQVLVGRVSQRLLQVVDSLVQRRVLCMASLQIYDFGCVALVRSLQGPQLLRVLIGGVPQKLLHVLDPLVHRRMMVLQVLGVLGVGLRQGLQRFGVMVVGISEELLEVVHALWQGGVHLVGLDDT